MNEEMAQGVELMLTGMGIVFLFLVMLIGAVKFMAYCVANFLPEVEVANTSASPRQVASTNGVTPTIAAVITAAVHQHREKHK